MSVQWKQRAGSQWHMTCFFVRNISFSYAMNSPITLKLQQSSNSSCLPFCASIPTPAGRYVSDTHNSPCWRPHHFWNKHELDNVLSWLESQPYPHKFFIGSNHDTRLALTPEIRHGYISSTYSSLTYLHESSAQVTIRGRTLRVYGSPYTPQRGSWVFQHPEVHAPGYCPSDIWIH